MQETEHTTGDKQQEISEEERAVDQSMDTSNPMRDVPVIGTDGVKGPTVSGQTHDGMQEKKERDRTFVNTVKMIPCPGATQTPSNRR
jgi:hypothetical protein